MSSNESSTLKLNLRRTRLCHIAVASEAMCRETRTRKCKTIELELTALAELNCEYADSDRDDRLALDELNAEGEELKQKLAVLHREQKKPMPFRDVIWPSLSAHEVAYAVLRQEGRPLHYDDITDRAIRSGCWVSHGRTPSHTMNSVMSTEIAQQGSESCFVRTHPGFYGLREWTDQDAT